LNRGSRSDLLLLLTAAIWGFAFVAQRAGMEYLGPFTFNTLRFALGSLVLLPFIYFTAAGRTTERLATGTGGRWRTLWQPQVLRGGLLAGTVLFIASSLQQTGLVTTTAGKAGFITGLYVIIVPMLGLALGRATGSGTWLGAVLAVAGLYLLNGSGGGWLARGDLLVLVGAFFWAGHVLVIDRLARSVDPLQLACLQFLTCAILSLIFAMPLESISLAAVRGAAGAVLFSGLFSVGLAFTLQVVAQKTAHPTHASIIMSLEAVFALLGGWLILSEPVGLRGLAGSALMLAGMLLSQLLIPRGKLSSTGQRGS
jgi:drug/metabolite transporter (DMT)-like permease